MKKFLAFIALSFFSLSSFAQQESLGCIDRDLKVQSEEPKNSFKKQGLNVFRDAMFTMQPLTPTPVGVQMVKGRMYQLIYVASKRASRADLEIFDGNDKKIVSKRMDKGGYNYIVYSFIPDKTDLYLVVLNQKFKGKNACGSFTILHDGPVEGAKPADNSLPKKK